jgi:hypothetical protein
MGPGLVMVAGIIGIFMLGFIFFITRHKERMSMIDKGVDASIFINKSSAISPTLKFGMLLVGLAIGILIGDYLHFLGMFKGTAFLSMAFLFGGLSLIANFIIERKLKEKEKQD